MRIFVCGDSTAASYQEAQKPFTGWGEVLGELLPGTEVVNHAMAGRSSKSFLAEGRLLEVEMALEKGDLMLIQFTHNDWSDLVWRHTDAHTSFAAHLALYAETARGRGAIPVLLTPIPVRSWQDGQLIDLHGAYPEVIRRIAREKGIPLIDVHQAGREALLALGEEASSPLYMQVEPGLYPAFPDGAKDNVHTQRAGALLYARIVAEGLKAHRLVG